MSSSTSTGFVPHWKSQPALPLFALVLYVRLQLEIYSRTSPDAFSGSQRRAGYPAEKRTPHQLTAPRIGVTVQAIPSRLAPKNWGNTRGCSEASFIQHSSCFV